MSSTEVTILSRSTFIDRTDPNKTKNVTRVVFQLPSGQVLNVTIPAEDVGTEKEDAAIATSIKNAPPSAIERKEIKLP